LAIKPNDWIAAFAELSRRLVHPAVATTPAQPMHQRLIGVLLAAPFIAGAAMALALSTHLGIGGTLAVVTGTFGAAWLAALAVASTARAEAVGAIALAAGAVCAGLAVAASGGLASPLTLLAAALPVEAMWVRRGRGTLGAGLAAMAAALAIGGIGAAAFASGLTPGALAWIAPAIYCATLILRAVPMFQPVVADEPASATDLVLRSAAVATLDKGGDVLDLQGASDILFGISRNLLLANGLFERIHVSDRVHYLCALADARASDEPRRAELRVRGPSVDDAGERFRTILLEAHQGRDGAVTAIFRDGGDVAQLRQALAAKQSSADEIDVAKSRFLAVVSHELRTPLNAIIGFSDMLLHEVACPLTDPKQKEYLDLIRESGSHLLALVNSVLDVSKIESGTYQLEAESFRFADAVAMSQAMMAVQAAGKEITLTTRLAANVGEVQADRRAVHQILINLVSNAVKFTPAGGEVTVGAKRLGTRLHFWVSDTGIGISEDNLDKLGRPFMQLRNDYSRPFEGTGLGLSVVKGLVTLHDGTMSVESAPGEGTTVSISLPIFGPSKKSDKPVPLNATPGDTNGEFHAPLRKAG
jgi:cell cycle sensor histidine kinase DivJ